MQKKEQNNAEYPRVSKAIHHPTTTAPRVMTQSPTSSPRKYIHVIPSEPVLPTTAKPYRKHKYNTRLSVAQRGANAIIDTDTGHALEYRHLIKKPQIQTNLVPLYEQ